MKNWIPFQFRRLWCAVGVMFQEVRVGGGVGGEEVIVFENWVSAPVCAKTRAFSGLLPDRFTGKAVLWQALVPLCVPGSLRAAETVLEAQARLESSRMRWPSDSVGSNVSSSGVTHGHRTCNDSDLASAFESHSRTFSFCSSLVSKVSHSSQSMNSCAEQGHEAARGTRETSMSTRVGVGCPTTKMLHGASRRGVGGSLNIIQKQAVPGN